VNKAHRSTFYILDGTGLETVTDMRTVGVNGPTVVDWYISVSLEKSPVFQPSSSGIKRKGVPLSFLLGVDPMDKQVTTWDRSMPGLGVRINSTGSSVYVLKYRFHKKQRLVTLCSTSLFTLEEARQLCLKVKFLVKEGIDPITQIADLLPGSRRCTPVSMRFDKFADVYLERHARAHNKSWKDDERRINSYLLPRFGKKHLHEIARSEVSEMHYEIGIKAPYQANRVKQLLHVMMKLAHDWGYLPESTANPAAGIRDYKEKPRSVFLSKKQLDILAPAINEVKNPVKRNLFWLLILTGFRLNELQTLPWANVNFDTRELTIYDTKNSTDLVQPMSESIYLLLKQLKDLNLSEEWVFYSERTRRHYVNLQATWYGILERSGLKLRVHDLRRTNGSWLAQEGYSLHLIAKVLNQTTAHVTACYAHFEKEDVKEALNTVSDITLKHLQQ